MQRKTAQSAVYHFDKSVITTYETKDMLFYDNKDNTKYNDIYQNNGTIAINAAENHNIIFNGTIEGENGTININNGTEENINGNYEFNNAISGNNIAIFNGAKIKLDKITQTDNSVTYGVFDLSGQTFENDANGGSIDTINDHIDAQNLGSVTLNSDINFKFDMNLAKDKERGTWYVQFYYTDWQGTRKKKFKRGFKTKAEAQTWAMDFLRKQHGDDNITFGQFIDEYYEDMSKRLKENTFRGKKYIIELKIRPYFGNKILSAITPRDIRKWQNELIGKGYKQTYLKTINNQLSALFNHAVNFRGLQTNPCRKAGSMGKSKADDVNFWTLDEYKQFIEGTKDQDDLFIAFETLYWTGMRVGEFLALTIEDIDLENRRIDINKSFQRINGRDVITSPKTENISVY